MKKNIKQIYIHINIKEKKYFVGTLANIQNKIYFEYDQKFLKKSLELSIFKLPLKSGAQENKDKEFNSLFGLFYDSFVEPLSEYTLEALLNIKENKIGALEYSLKKKIPLKDSTSTIQKEFFLSETTPSIVEKKILLQVNQRKNTFLYNNENLKEEFSYWLLKIPSSKTPYYSANIEYAYSLMAKKAGLDIPQNYLFKNSSQHSYYGVKRFDKEGKNSIHIHSLAGLIHSDYRISNLDYDDFLSITLAITKNIKDLHKAFRLVCYIVLSHIKDHNEQDIIFLMTDKGDWHLAPASNLSFSYGNSGKYNMKVMGEKSWIRKKHLIQLAQAHDIKNYIQIIDEVSTAISNWTTFATIANVPKEEALKINTILHRINLNEKN